VPVRAFALGVALVRRVNVELHPPDPSPRNASRRRTGPRDPVLGGHIRVGRERQHNLAGHLRVLAPLRRLGGVPQTRGPRQTAPPHPRVGGRHGARARRDGGSRTPRRSARPRSPRARCKPPNAPRCRRNHGRYSGHARIRWPSHTHALFWSAASRVAPAMHIASARLSSLCSLGAEPAAAVWWARTEVR